MTSQGAAVFTREIAVGLLPNFLLARNPGNVLTRADSTSASSGTVTTVTRLSGPSGELLVARLTYRGTRTGSCRPPL